ncbi:MAG: Ldh family oxidoreductase [Alphaproteobacteria bacterium]|nr:Ldh family oxidoreductase [Alphaproteobacteria bacterium]
MAPRYKAEDLVGFAQSLLTKLDVAAEHARITAEVLVEGDLMGHTTHGLALLAQNLTELEAGRYARSGAPKVLSDRPAAVVWEAAPEGARLLGPYIVRQAFALAAERARIQGTGTVVVRRSGHIACLAAYFSQIVELGLVGLLYSSDPTVASVAPHGGLEGRYTPNPMAAGWPTAAGPVIMDVSTSITTNGMVTRKNREGGKLPGAWLKSAEGEPTDDPGVLFAKPPGALLPLGGMDAGHKGFAMALLMEALTSGLGGYGRADKATGWGASLFVQVIDPAAFGGTDSFQRETGWLAEACRGTPVKPGDEPVRVPGDGALARKAEQQKAGVMLHPSVMPSLKSWCEKLGVVPPAPIA